MNSLRIALLQLLAAQAEDLAARIRKTGLHPSDPAFEAAMRETRGTQAKLDEAT